MFKRYSPCDRISRRYGSEVFLFTDERVMEPGHYTHEFQLYLGEDVPDFFVLAPHYSATSCKHLLASMTHYIKLKLDVHGGPAIESTSRILFHKARVEELPVRSRGSSMSSSIRSLGLLPRGSCELVAGVPRDVFSPDETIPIQCTVSNSSQKLVMGIVCRLVQTVTIELGFFRVREFTRAIQGARAPLQVLPGRTGATTVFLSVQSKDDNGYATPTQTEPSLPWRCEYHIAVECIVAHRPQITASLPIRVIGSSALTSVVDVPPTWRPSAVYPTELFALLDRMWSSLPHGYFDLNPQLPLLSRFD